VAVGKEQSAKPGSAKADLPTATWHTVGKSFANYHASSRHSHVAPSALPAGFADCWFQKMFADWPPARQSAKKENIFFLKCSLPTAFKVAVGKDSGVFLPSFADCNSRQSWNFFFCFCFLFSRIKTLQNHKL
jgi:hypothetical protein